MTQYEIDNRGEFAELFQAIRKIVLSYPYITEIKNLKQTSYREIRPIEIRRSFATY